MIQENKTIDGRTKRGADLALAKRLISPVSHAAVLAGELSLAGAKDLGRDRGPDAPGTAGAVQDGPATAAPPVPVLRRRHQGWQVPSGPRRPALRGPEAKPGERPPAEERAVHRRATEVRPREGADLVTRVILYARVSTKKQAEQDRFSIPQQLGALREYAAREGYEVPDGHEITDPGYSGATLERPGMDRVRDLVAAGGVSAVLAQDRDRFAREPAYLGLLKEEFAERSCSLRAMNGRGDDSPEGELTDGILDQIAKFERAKTAERARRGRLQRAREGKVSGSGPPPYGFAYDADRTEYVVNEQEMGAIRTIFRMVGLEGTSLGAVARELEERGVQARGGGKDWSKVALRRVILLGDHYRRHTYGELEGLVAEGVLRRDILASLDPEGLYGVSWFGRERVTMSGGKGKKRTHRQKPREEWVAVPVCDPTIPTEWVDLARKRVKENRKVESKGRRFFELAHGFAYCAQCGRRMAGHTFVRGSGALAAYYVCGNLRNGKACPPGRYFQAGELELRLRDFVRRLLRNPDALREQVERQLELERAALRNPERQLKGCYEALHRLDLQRERRLEQHALGAIDTDQLKAHVAGLDRQRAAIKTETDRLTHVKDELGRLEELKSLLPEYLRELPDLLEPPRPSRGMRFSGLPERALETEGGRKLEIRRLTPESLSMEDEGEYRKRLAEYEDRVARAYRRAYDDLRLGVDVHKDGTLEVSWSLGKKVLRPGTNTKADVAVTKP